MNIISKKISGGKLVKIEYVSDGTITHFKLYGDFFLYPETLLPIIEKNLLNSSLMNISRNIKQTLRVNNGEFIGVAPEDIQFVIEENELIKNKSDEIIFEENKTAKIIFKKTKPVTMFDKNVIGEILK